MVIRSMHLKNYRCFKDFDIDFDDQLTVVVGINGAGKTAVLDAISVFLKWAGHHTREFVEVEEYDLTPHIHINDISIGSDPKNFLYQMSLKSFNMSNSDTSQISFEYNRVGDRDIQLSVSSAAITYKAKTITEKPIFVAYKAERFVAENDLALTQETHRSTAYHHIDYSFNRTIDFARTLAWFNDADADEARAMRDRGVGEEFPELKAVRDALSKALLGKYEKPRMIGNPPELIISESGSNQYYKVSQLSDGYRAMLALVMDLARRMAQSQADSKVKMESPLNAPAIVLIDEVELHLHPSWQQTVLITLMDIFPNTQFIVTTHSPQVLTSIPPKHIRILSDGEAYTYNEQTQGAEASRLLKRVFNVDPRPISLKIVQALTKYAKLVYEEQWDTAEALELREMLGKHFGKDDPELFELDLHIENKKWESGL